MIEYYLINYYLVVSALL